MRCRLYRAEGGRRRRADEMPRRPAAISCSASPAAPSVPRAARASRPHPCSGVVCGQDARGARGAWPPGHPPCAGHPSAGDGGEGIVTRGTSGGMRSNVQTGGRRMVTRSVRSSVCRAARWSNCAETRMPRKCHCALRGSQTNAGDPLQPGPTPASSRRAWIRRPAGGRHPGSDCATGGVVPTVVMRPTTWVGVADSAIRVSLMWTMSVTIDWTATTSPCLGRRRGSRGAGLARCPRAGTTRASTQSNAPPAPSPAAISSMESRRSACCATVRCDSASTSIMSHWCRVMKIVSRVIHETFICLVEKARESAWKPRDPSSRAAAGESRVAAHPPALTRRTVTSSADRTRLVV